MISINPYFAYIEYPAEVEKVVLEHPGVAEVSVIGVPDPKFGEGIKAVCVLKPGYVQFVASLPKKEDGSIDRPKVKELYGR